MFQASLEEEMENLDEVMSAQEEERSRGKTTERTHKYQHDPPPSIGFLLSSLRQVLDLSEKLTRKNEALVAEQQLLVRDKQLLEARRGGSPAERLLLP